MKAQDTGVQLLAPSRAYFPSSISSLVLLVQGLALLLQLDLRWPAYLENAQAWTKYAVSIQFPLLAGGDDEDWRDVLYICAAIYWLLVVFWAQVACQLGSAFSRTNSTTCSHDLLFVCCGGQASSEGSSRVVLYAHRALLFAPVALIIVGALVPAAPAPVFWMGVVGCVWVPIVIAYLLCYRIVFWASSLLPRFQRYADVRSTEAVAQLCAVFLFAAFFMSSSMAIEALLDDDFDQTLAIVLIVLGLGFPTLCLCAAVISARPDSEDEEDNRRVRRPSSQQMTVMPWDSKALREPAEAGFLSFMNVIGRGVLVNYKDGMALYALVTILERPLFAVLIYGSKEGLIGNSATQGLLMIIIMQAALGVFCILDRPYKHSLDFFADLGVRSAICLTAVFTLLLKQGAFSDNLAGFLAYAAIWLAVMMCIAGAVIFFLDNRKIHRRRLELQPLVQAQTEHRVKSLGNSFVSSCKDFEIVQCCQPLQILWVFRHYRGHMRNVHQLYNASLILRSTKTKRPVNTGVTFKQVLEVDEEQPFCMSEEVEGDLAIRVLVECIKSGHSPSFASFAGKGVTNEGAQVLGEELKARSTIEELDLSNNGIGKHGLAAMMPWLLSDHTLVDLNLSNNKLGTDASVVLAQLIRSNSTLTTLTLDGMQLGPRGAELIAEALNSTPSSALRVLSLSDNGIGDEGAMALIRTVESEHNSIQELHIRDSSIADTVWEQFIEQNMAPNVDVRY